jgi:hypothetical protein
MTKIIVYIGILLICSCGSKDQAGSSKNTTETNPNQPVGSASSFTLKGGIK